jgi:hypothetical protein
MIFCATRLSLIMISAVDETERLCHYDSILISFLVTKLLLLQNSFNLSVSFHHGLIVTLVLVINSADVNGEKWL